MSQDLDAVWLACALDAEGSITYWEHNGRRFYRISLGNTSEAFANKFRNLVQVEKMVIHAPRPPGKLPLFYVDIRDRDRIEQILLRILPYLIIKKTLAESVLSYYSEHPRVSSKEYSELSRRKWSDARFRAKVLAGLERSKPIRVARAKAQWADLEWKRQTLGARVRGYHGQWTKSS